MALDNFRRKQNSGEDITQQLINDTLTAQTQINGRRRRQATDTREVFQFDPNFNASANAQWPTASGLNESYVRAVCVNKVQTSPAFTQCAQFSDDNYSDEIDNCVTDVQLMDNLTVADAIVQVIQESCGTNLAVNSSTWEDPNPDVADVTPTLDYDVATTLCPDQCSGQGTCVNGECQCHNNYGGFDCSFQVSLSPTVISRGSNALCQTNLYSCARATVRGDNFIQGVDGGLTCHVTPINVNANRFQYQGQIQQVAATYRSQYEVLCDLPEARSYAIRISNDGQSQSFNEALFVAYDSQCFTCLVADSVNNANCTAKDSTCVIEGQCYNHGETHPTDPCLECSASSYDRWSAKAVEQCQTTPGVSTTPESTTPTITTPTTTEGREDEKSKRFNTETIIIAASVSSVIVVLLTIGITVYCVRRRQQRALRRSLAARESDEGSSYERVYNGSFGVRTQKSLAFRNPQTSRVYDYYEPTL